MEIGKSRKKSVKAIIKIILNFLKDFMLLLV
jgi:hypothetical protein